MVLPGHKFKNRNLLEFSLLPIDTLEIDKNIEEVWILLRIERKIHIPNTTPPWEKDSTITCVKNSFIQHRETI